MTLDVLNFIDSKGGNAKEVRESQQKRGEPVELVDQVIDMYAEWVKSVFTCRTEHRSSLTVVTWCIMLCATRQQWISSSMVSASR